MSNFICEKLVDERKIGFVLSYTLKDNQFFFQTAYKILQNKENKNFVKCYKSFWNGKVKLSYPLDNYNTLFHYSNTLSKDQYYLIIQNILSILNDFRSNGLIQIETIDMSYDKVLFNDNLNVFLVCVPLAISSTPETMSMFDYTAKNLIAEIIEKSGYAQQMEFGMIYRDCKSTHINMSDIYLNFKMKRYITELNMVSENREMSTYSTLVLKGITTNEQILIDQQIVILGKSPDMSDRVVSGSSSVSRRHCQIVREMENFFVEDLKSLNHTFVNSNMLNSGDRIVLHRGDYLKLADLEFEVM